MGVEPFFYPKLTTIPPFWQGSAFSTLGMLWITSNNFLTPTDCKIRKVKDLGAIKNSLEISLFDRCIVTESSSTKTLTRVAQSVALLGVFVFAAPLGSIWHLGNCVYYTVVWLKGGNRTDLIKHIKPLFADLFWSSSYIPFCYFICHRLIIASCDPVFVEVLQLIIVWGALPTMLMLFLILWTWIEPESLGNFIIWNSDTKASVPFYLKRRFGLIGEDGWLLTFDEAVDDITIEKDETRGGVVVSGYFYSLWKEQAQEILLECINVINRLQLELPKEKIEEFSKKPESFLPYLQEYCKNSSLQCNAELASSISKIDRLLKNYAMIDGILDRLFRSHKIKRISFPYSPESCRRYFSLYNEDNQSSPGGLLGEFENRLAGIKQMGLSAGGPNGGFTETKQKILAATNAYDILGLAEGVSESEYKKAYFKNVKQISPDKLPWEWKTQGEELFKVMDAAYKYVISTYTSKNPETVNSPTKSISSTQLMLLDCRAYN